MGGVDVVDASGSTFVPGMVDGHSHLTMPGGAHWIDRGSDTTEALLGYAEANARLLTGAGVRWARDVGSVTRSDPDDGGRSRAVSIRVRERWRGRDGYPHVRAAGTWIMARGLMPGLSVEAGGADELLGAAMTQLDDGANLVKLYLDGPDPGASPWTAGELRTVVDAVHARGCRVTAHSGYAAGARAGAEAGIDALEHGFELDAETARLMAANGVRLVSTLCVLASWRTFGRTTNLPRFASDEGRAKVEARRERAMDSVRLAHAAGVSISTGTDFGGGSTRANQLAWEVEQLVEAGWSRGRRWAPRPGGAASCWARIPWSVLTLRSAAPGSAVPRRSAVPRVGRRVPLPPCHGAGLRFGHRTCGPLRGSPCSLVAPPTQTDVPLAGWNARSPDR